MNNAIEYAKRKIAMFPDMYRAYAHNLELFRILVDECRRQLIFSDISVNLTKEGVTNEKNTIR